MRQSLSYSIIILSLYFITCGSEDTAFKKAAEAKSIDQYENFMSKFPDSPLADSALGQVYFLTKQADSLETYKQFVAKHPETVFTDSVMNNIWVMTQNDSSIETYKQFITDYPEQGLKDSAFVEMFSLLVSKNEMQLYEQFIADYPEHAMKDSAITLVYELTFEECTIKGFKSFLQKYPESKHAESSKDMIKRFEFDEILTTYHKNGFPTVKQKFPDSNQTQSELNKYTYNPNYTLGKRYQLLTKMGIRLPHDLFQGSSSSGANGQVTMQLFKGLQEAFSTQDVNEQTVEWINLIGLALKHCKEKYSGNSFVSNINREIIGPLIASNAVKLSYAHTGKLLGFVVTNAVFDMLGDHRDMINNSVKDQLKKLKSKISDPFLVKKLDGLII